MQGCKLCLTMLALDLFAGMLPADLHAVVADAAGAAAADMLDVATMVEGSGAQPVQMGACCFS
jgi:hypothetical protein